jgi:predicted transcriptional regulator
MPTTTVRIPAEIGAQLDAVAQARGSDSQEIAVQAIRDFLLAEEERQRTEQALAELDRGEGMPAEQVRDEMHELLKQRGIGMARQQHIRSRVDSDY